MKVLVTGGAGFIGSHITDRLIADGHDVTIYDNLTTGRLSYLKGLEPKFSLVKADILDLQKLKESMKGIEFVFHLAANADVRGGIKKTRVDLEQNTLGTWNVLEAMRLNEVKKIAFSSSATVYGEPKKFPTPEDVPVVQTSLYGASKLAGEAMIQAYCNYYDMKSWIFRFVSWIGERYSHGVIFDFIRKLKENPKELEILGDGRQKKSYLYVKDGVQAVFHAIENFDHTVNIFNIGHEKFMEVTELAGVVCGEMGLKDVKYNYTGGSRGWKGDSPLVHLDISKLKSAGWSPETSIEQGIRKTARYILDNPEIYERS